MLTLDRVVPRPRRVAIGMFDGVHQGHRRVIAGSETVLTFDPHPLYVLRPEAAPRILTPREIKARLLEELGVEEMVIIEFDQEFSRKSAEDFVREILIGRLGATHVSVGENFRFGAQAQGDPVFLEQFDEFETEVVPLVEHSGEVVSSSQIRGLVSSGEIVRANDLLGSRFAILGEVVHGDKRGRELGYPTANVIPGEHDCVPAHGIYAALTNGLPSAVSVGVRPTFKSAGDLLVEAFLIDWSGDLYGQKIEIEFLERLRGEERFERIEDLVAQMEVDVSQARQACAHLQ